MRIYMTKIITLFYSQENSGNYLHGLLKKKLTLVLDVVLVMTIDTLIEILCIKFMYGNVVVYFILHRNKKRKKIQKFSVYAICIVRLSVTVPMRYCACVVFNLKLQNTFVKIWIFFFIQITCVFRFFWLQLFTVQDPKLKIWGFSIIYFYIY